MAAAPTAAQLRPDDVEVGDWIDVRDVTGAWCGCRALEKTPQEVLVQTPQRWGPCADLWLPLPSPRAAPFRRFSQGPVTSERRQSSWEEAALESRNCIARLAELEAQLPDVTWPAAKVTGFLCGDVPELVDRLLNFSYAGAGARALEANRLFLQFLRFLSAWFRAAPQLFQPRAEPAVAACAAALPDLASVLGRTASAAERRAASLFEAHVSLPGTATLWPGADADWLRVAVTKAAGAALVPREWLLVRLRGLEEAGPPLELPALEEAMQRSSLLQCNAAAFCTMGGVEALLAALALGQGEGTALPLPLEGVRALLVALSMMAATQGLTQGWAEAALPRLLAAVRGRVICMRDEEVKVVDRDQILRCVCEPAAGLLVAAPTKCSRLEIEDLREELLLLFHRRRLQSPFLEKRLKALGDVKDVVDRSTSVRTTPGWTGFWNREQQQPPAGKKATVAPAAAELSSPSGLARWLADEERHGLLPILFGARSHTEVLRRSGFLLRLLARERLLTQERLGALWASSCSADKHEDLTCCVLELLVEIAGVLEPPQIRFLVSRVVEIPPQSLDVKFLRFLRDLLLASVRIGRTAKPEDGGDPGLDDGLAVFWSCLHSEAALVPVSAREARACFLELLRSSQLAGFRQHYLQECWRALREKSPPSGPMACLFREILGTFPEGEEASPSVGAAAPTGTSTATPLMRRDAVLLQLSNQEGSPKLGSFLLDGALAALSMPAAAVPVVVSAPKAAASAAVALQPADLESCIGLGEDPGQPAHHALAATILETLFYVLTESSLQVSFADMERLWGAVRDGEPRGRDLVARCLSLAAGFTFASKVFNRRNWMVWQESAYTRFFQEVLLSGSRMDYARLSHDGLVCFVNYMKLCNLTLFNSGLPNDMLYVPETPSYGTGSGDSTPSYSQLVGRGGLVRSRSLAAAAGRRFRVVRWGLAGAEELWEVAWQVRDPEVFEACGDVLASLFVFLHPHSSLHRRRSEVQSMLLRKCMDVLRAPAEPARVHKALALLAKFVSLVRLSSICSQVSACWPVTSGGQELAARRRGELSTAFHVAYRTEGGAGGATHQRTIYMQPSATVGQLRAKVSAALQMRTQELALYACPGLQLLDRDLDPLTLEECQVSSSLYAALARSQQAASDDGVLPLWQLAERDVDTLLDLIAPGAQLRCEPAVWALFGCLPVHEHCCAIYNRVAKWGLEAGGPIPMQERPAATSQVKPRPGSPLAAAGPPTSRSLPRRPLARVLEDESTASSSSSGGPLPPFPGVGTAGSLTDEFKAFWSTQVWVGQEQPQAHRLLYGLRVIYSLMMGEAPSARERLPLPRGEGLAGEAWSYGFLRAGGLELLLGALAQLGACRDSHALLCFSLLAECVRELLGKWQADPVATAGLGTALRGLLPPLAPQLLEALLRLVAEGYEVVEVVEEDPQLAAFSASAVQLCLDAAPQPEVSDAGLCASRLFSLLHAVVRLEPGCVAAVRSFGNASELLARGLLSPDTAVREAVAEGVRELCVRDPSDDGSLSSSLLAKLLFEVLPRWQEQPARSEQLFTLLARLLQRHRSPQPAATGLVPQRRPPAPRLDELARPGTSLPQLLASLVSQLSCGCDGGTLLAMLQFLHSALHCFPGLKAAIAEALAAEVLRCCFGPAASCEVAAPLCRTGPSRQAALALLLELATDDAAGCLATAQPLLSVSLAGPVPGCRWRSAEWVVLPDTGAKSAAGFVGLKNLGATCYMNSVLQQLYAHPEFRQGVLLGSASAKQRDGAELFYQLQVLFSSLNSSERQYYSPKGFCAAFRDWEGRPVNVLQQMDADEFLNLLMDQLERAMGGEASAITERKARVGQQGGGGASLLRRLFGGKLCTEIIPKTISAPRSERHEDFLVLSLQVKGKASVRASLAAFVEGEILEGDNAYYSEEAGCKVDAEKRTSICCLPETLVLGLKRFEFDLDAMQKVKVNDLCEFPMRLNMWPYTKRALDGEEASPEETEALEYTLCGIVLHSGTTDSGHYSSLVKVAEEAGLTQWYEFNDTMVTPFNEEDIPQEAFGGADSDDIRGMARSKNAYLLFYERAGVARGQAVAGASEAPRCAVEVVEAEAVSTGAAKAVGTAAAASTVESVEADAAATGAAEAIGTAATAATAAQAPPCVVETLEPEAVSTGAAEAIGTTTAVAAAQAPDSEAPATAAEAVAPEGDLAAEAPRQAWPESPALAAGSPSPDVAEGAVASQAPGQVAAAGAAPVGREGSSEAIRRSVENANCQHWHVQALFSPEFADFAWMLACNFQASPALLAPGPAAEKQLLESVGALKFMQLAQLRREGGASSTSALPALLCRLVAGFMCTVLVRSRDRRQLAEWANLLVRLLRRSGPEAQRWFAALLASHGFVREMLLECPLPEARAAVLAVATHALRWLYEQEAPALCEHAERAPPGTLRPESTDAPLLAQIWATLVEVLPAAGLVEAHANFQHFLALVQDWLRLGPEAMAWARKAGGLEELLEFSLQDAGSKALTAALESAQRWYRPNPLRTASAQELPAEPGALVSREAVLGLAEGAESGTQDPWEQHPDGSFERQLRGEANGEVVELGPLWGTLALLLDGDAASDHRQGPLVDALLRRLVRLGCATTGSRAPASRLLQLLCRGDLARSQGVSCRICERVDEADGRALRSALRMGTALVELSDVYAQQRAVFLAKSLLHVAKNNRKYFRTMHMVVHYIVKWCRRRPELPQWLLADAGGSLQYRWLEAWVKDNASAGEDSWQSWQAGRYPPLAAPPADGASGGRRGWCAEVAPLVRRIVRGEALPRGDSAAEGGDSENELAPEANAPRERLAVPPLPKTLLGVPRLPPPVLSKVQMVNGLAASARTYQVPVSTVPAPPAW